MKTVINRQSLLIIIGVLVLGVLIGWGIKPASNTSVKDDHNHKEGIWTCSMHPQIKRNEPGQCPICGMDLVPITSLDKTNHNPMIYEMTPEAVAMANIQTTVVSGSEGTGELHLVGKVEVDERELASVTATFPGRIEKLYINFTGQVVKRGERLATLYSPNLLTAQRELLESISTKQTYPELYEAARQKLLRWKLTEQQIEKIEQSGKPNPQFDILADRGGVVTTRNVTMGDYVNAGTILFEITDLGHLWIVLDAYESDLAKLKVGDLVKYTVEGIPGARFTSKVSYIDPVIDPSTRTASVRAEVNNTNGKLKPEMFVNANIMTPVASDDMSLSIPRTALLWTGKRSVVYVKMPEAEFPSYEMREVSIGNRQGDVYPIRNGLEPGEEVVTNGVFAVDAAAQLSGNYSMMNRPQFHTNGIDTTVLAKIAEKIINQYLKLKNALVLSNLKEAQNSSKLLLSLVKKVDMNSLSSAEHAIWMKWNSNLESSSDGIIEAKELQEARKSFSKLSQVVLEMADMFHDQEQTRYKDYCPMAIDNQGAYWLSETGDIRNPYFGNAMLTCGEIRKVYKAVE